MPKKKPTRRRFNAEKKVAVTAALESELRYLREKLEASRAREELLLRAHPMAWKPVRLTLGANVLSEQGDYRLTKHVLHPGRRLYRREHNLITDETRDVEIDYLNWRPGPCLAFCANAELKYLLYPSDLGELRQLAVAFLKPMFDDVEKTDLFSERPFDAAMSTSKAADAYHKHLDECQRCMARPFDLCATGATLLSAAVQTIKYVVPPLVKNDGADCEDATLVSARAPHIFVVGKS